MWQLYFFLKQGETRTSHGPIPHPLNHQHRYIDAISVRHEKNSLPHHDNRSQEIRDITAEKQARMVSKAKQKQKQQQTTNKQPNTKPSTGSPNHGWAEYKTSQYSIGCNSINTRDFLIKKNKQTNKHIVLNQTLLNTPTYPSPIHSQTHLAPKKKKKKFSSKNEIKKWQWLICFQIPKFKLFLHISKCYIS